MKESAVTNELTAVSLFAGVGGFDLAMQRNGINVVATVEIDKYARGVLQHQFPEATHFEDVTKVSADELRTAGFIPERGIITGGFPCQDLSVAGKRAGLAGKRSGLYWEIIRLVDELSPKYLVLENVPGLLSSNGGRDMGVVIAALTDRGYGVSWRVLDAQYFGVAQRRRRVFIVACAGDNGAASSEILAISEGLRGHLEASKPTRKVATVDVGEGSEEPIRLYGQTGFARYTEGVTTLTATTHKRSEDNVVIEPELIIIGPLTALGMSSAKGTETTDSHHYVLEPTLAYPIQDGREIETWTGGAVVPTPNAFENANDTRDTAIIFDRGSYGETRMSGEIVPTLQARMGTGGNNTPMVAYPIQDGRDIEKLQNGLGVGKETDPSYTLDSTGGQSVVYPIQGSQIGREDKNGPQGSGFGEKDGPMFTENVTDRHAVAIMPATVRRLTPTECERLQGFPDGWTTQRIDEKKGLIAQADSARYKQMGNAVAVPVVEWVMRRLVEQENLEERS